MARAVVYVVRGSDGRVKVGHTQDMKRRMGFLKCTKKLDRVEVLHVTKPTVKARWIETDALRALRAKSGVRRGEWFSLPVESALQAVKDAEIRSRSIHWRNVPKIRPQMEVVKVTLSQHEIDMVHEVAEDFRRRNAPLGFAGTMRYILSLALNEHRQDSDEVSIQAGQE